METEILVQLQGIEAAITALTVTIKMIGGLIFGSLLFVHFGRFMRP